MNCPSCCAPMEGGVCPDCAFPVNRIAVEEQKAVKKFVMNDFYQVSS